MGHNGDAILCAWNALPPGTNCQQAVLCMPSSCRTNYNSSESFWKRFRLVRFILENVTMKWVSFWPLTREKLGENRAEAWERIVGVWQEWFVWHDNEQVVWAYYTPLSVIHSCLFATFQLIVINNVVRHAMLVYYHFPFL